MVIGASIGIPAYRWTMAAPAAARPTRFTIEPDAVSRTGTGRDIAISHDGSLVAFVNTGGALMLRSLTEAQSKPLTAPRAAALRSFPLTVRGWDSLTRRAR